MQLHGKTLAKFLALLVLSMAAIGSAQNNGQPERSAVKQDTNEQQAVEQLRAIVEAIKRCPKAESPVELGVYLYSAPQITDWNVIPRKSARSDWLGYIEFIKHIYYKPNPLPECKKKDSKCKWDNWEANQTNSIVESALPPDEWRYEFDVRTLGMEFFRSMVKHQTDDETHWTGIQSSPDESCEGDAVTMVLNNRTPQIPVATLAGGQKRVESEAEPMVKVPPPFAAPSSPAQPSANAESAQSAESIATLKEQAATGDAKAQFSLGLTYLLGRGVPQDEAQAVRWFRKAAEQGNALAQDWLGAAYANGQSVTQDYPQAAAWFRKAADQGDAAAQNNLGRAYYDGQGVPQDYAEAYFWFDLAAAGKLDAVNAEGAYTGRDAAATYLTPADLSRVQERARKWFEDHPAKQ
jgi:Sel1 repeat